MKRVITVAVCLAALKAASVVAPRPSLRARFGTSSAVYDARGRLLRLTLAPDEQYRLWVPVSRVSPLLTEATQLYEDQFFRWHPGVNPLSIVRAMFSTATGPRRIGGSTLTMQLARRVWGTPSRTIVGKAAQLVRAMALEDLYSKDQILEAYLDTVPYGGNVEGVGAASLIYFGKTADKLTLPEALTLAVIPQSPRKRGQSGDDAGPEAMEARQRLYARWTARHPSAKRDEALLQLPMSLRSPSELPFLAPHFVDGALAARRGEAELTTTLDLRQQRLLERHVKAYVARQSRIGIHNAVALLVDARTMAIKAEVGSADWADETINGQVNGAKAPRSPGSALKPFVYALGIEQGVIHPTTMLKDVPTRFGAFSPENFDGRFAGPLAAKDALIRSRNIPALTVAGKLNKPSLYDFLKLGGVGRMGPESKYGLGLALGAHEVTMEELATLYGVLASGGTLRPLRDFVDEPVPEGTRLLSEESTWLVLDMLRQNPRPDRAHGAEGTHLPVAWKTGTSWGFRDAWTVGVFGPYILLVWVGNFDGEGNPAFVGIGAAAPLFFEIVDSMAADESIPDEDRAPPKSLKRVSVCSVSGQLPGPSCPHTKMSWFWPGRSPIETCDIHKAVRIDDKTGLRACSATTGATHVDVYEDWPSDLARLFELAGLPRRRIPNAAPGCEGDDGPSGTPPHITSPASGVTYALRGAGDKIALTSVTAGDAREVHWFLGRQYLGRSPSGVPFFVQPPAGSWVVRAVDEHGRSDSRELRVEVMR